VLDLITIEGFVLLTNAAVLAMFLRSAPHKPTGIRINHED